MIRRLYRSGDGWLLPCGIVRRGPKEPPPLRIRVEYRPESPQPWWLVAADGSALRLCGSVDAAQAAYGGATPERG